MTSKAEKEYGIVIFLDSLGTRQRILDDISQFLADWDSVLNRLDENVKVLEQNLSGRGYKTGIRTKDIFDNIQIFFPSDDPHTDHINFSGGTPLWWTLQHSADLLTNLIRYGIIKNIYFRGCISMGYIQEYRNGYYSAAMIENADFANSCEMIGTIVSPSAMRVLNNKTHNSSPRFFQYVKYRIPIKEPTGKRRKKFDRLAALNLTRESTIFRNIVDDEVEKVIQQEIQRHQYDPKVREKWINTLSFMKHVREISDENQFL
jgi:hypothetical protein